MNNTWPFDQPENCGVFSMRQIMENGAPILFVSHDEEDHGWQFLNGSDNPDSSDLMIVCFSHIVHMDPSLILLADLLPGWQAWRSSLNDPWERATSPIDDEEFVVCSCCGKLVPSSNVELSFRRPDEIAALGETEIIERCKFNDDFFVLDEQRYFIRCTLPLPLRESADHYAIGVWAEIGQIDFTKVWDLWGDENQSNLPALCGTLANNVPLTVGSERCAIEVKLTGPTTRPEIKILEKTCSLHEEQSCGITAHRASEYTSLVRG